MTDTKLIPRQRPQMPPKLEMKSNQVIFTDDPLPETEPFAENGVFCPKYAVFRPIFNGFS